MSFIENYKRITNQISDICAEAHRPDDCVTLIGVTKRWPKETVEMASKLGLKDFGENYVQEFLPKQEAFPNLNWHFIGHLQSNKIKLIADRCELIHSVDRQSVLDSISKYSSKVQNILIEVNVANEGTKQGVDLNEADRIIEHSKQISNIHVQGLMTMPPPDLNEKQSREIYQKLYQWGRDYGLEVFSFGTSYDFRFAILEGATHVRLGTILFGSRS